MSQATGGTASRKGLSRDDVKSLTDRVLSFAKADQTRVGVNSGVSELHPHRDEPCHDVGQHGRRRRARHERVRPADRLDRHQPA